MVCTPLAWLLARGRLPLPRVWEAGVLCSLLLPPLVIGLLLIYLVGPFTPIGEWFAALHQSATNTFLALVIAQVYESAPYYVLGALAAFNAVDPRMEQQAALLGDRPFRVLRRVSLPLAAPGLAMALAIAWARAMGAFGAVIIVAYHPYGLPLQIWTTLQETGLASALPFAVVLLVVALPLPLAAYVWSARAQSRRRG
jgi:molybdate/tungstate transport system permease protein